MNRATLLLTLAALGLLSASCQDVALLDETAASQGLVADGDDADVAAEAGSEGVNMGSESAPTADGESTADETAEGTVDSNDRPDGDHSTGPGEEDDQDNDTDTVWTDEGADADTTTNHDDGIGPESELSRVSWLLRAYGPLRGPLTKVVADETYSLEFEENQTVTGVANCNICDGTFDTGLNSTILINMPCTATECSPPSTVPNYGKSIADVTTYELRDGWLYLYFVDRFTGEASVLVYEPQAD
jgi:hypothetical protein